MAVRAAIRRLNAPLDGSGYAYANSHYVLRAAAAGGAVDSSEGVAEYAGERYGAGIRIAADGTLFHAGRWGGTR